MSLESSFHEDTSALPGGNKIIGSPTSGRRHWRKIVEMQLPDDATLTRFVDKFFVSVDWFMMVCIVPLTQGTHVPVAHKTLGI